METFSWGGVKSRISSIPVPFLFPLWDFEKEGLMERRNEFVFAPLSLSPLLPPSLFLERKIRFLRSRFFSVQAMNCISIKMICHIERTCLLAWYRQRGILKGIRTRYWSHRVFFQPQALSYIADQPRPSPCGDLTFRVCHRGHSWNLCVVIEFIPYLLSAAWLITKHFLSAIVCLVSLSSNWVVFPEYIGPSIIWISPLRVVGWFIITH